MLNNIFSAVVNHPKKVILLCVIACAFLVYNIQYFRLDASSDTLLLENDTEIGFYDTVKEKYGSDNYLIITYSPNNSEELFSPKHINNIEQITAKLDEIKNISSISSITNVPLIGMGETQEISEEIEFTSIADGANLVKAKSLLTSSKLYKDLLVDSKATTTAIITTLDYSKYDKATYYAQQDQDVANIRSIISNYSNDAKMFIGGLPMIVSDSIGYVKDDLMSFGILVFLVISFIIWVLTRKIKWVILTSITCVVTIVSMAGLLGLLNFPVTVVSSNFISLLAIITVSLSIHLIVKYKETVKQDKSKLSSHGDVIAHTLTDKFKPCLYTALTTIVAFASLAISDIKPVVDFGYMMIMGTIIALVYNFTLFPAVLKLTNKTPVESDLRIISNFLNGLFNITHANKAITVGFALFITGLSFYGLSKVSVENRFIDYFKDSTEIYQGMSVIDNHLGGTTPLEVIITAPASHFEQEDEFFSDFAEGEEETSGQNNYWLNSVIKQQVDDIHAYLDNHPAIGKVLSLSTTLDILYTIEPELSSIKLQVIKGKISPEYASILFDPYISKDGNEIRFSLRIFESHKGLDRTQIINDIHNYLVNQQGINTEDIRITGMAVLYNNMLQSLYDSQIITIGFVFIAIFIMFMALFKSYKIALIGITPNMFAAGFILSFMGYANIPLDIMTISIAAICIGIAIDNTIHYVDRYRAEYKLTNDHQASAVKCQHTIATAILYTGLAVFAGFLVLVLSQFIPTVYFGILTGLSMIIALLANLVLLPIMMPLALKKHVSIE
jgi:predicted RND superfamily exporter protein